jgi:hypothetical protein
VRSKTPAQNISDDEDLERRKHSRKWTRWPAQLRTSADSFECRVLNLSYRGAKVQLTQTVREREAVTLIMEPLGEFSGVVSWRAKGCIGLRFAQHYTPGIRGRMALPRVRLVETFPRKHSAD